MPVDRLPTPTSRGLRRLRSLGLVVWLLALALPARAASVPDFPKPRGYVNDFAGVLDSGAQTELDAMLHETERQTTAEIALVTVKSLDGLTVEEYANRLFEQWGIGKKAKDNGVLVLVAPTERRIRIEVGYGLEPVLPDGLAGEIIRKAFLPAFKRGDYRDGILTGMQRVVSVVRRHHPLTPAERRALDNEPAGSPPFWLVPFLGLFVAAGSFAVGVGLRTKTIFPLLWGTIFGGVPLLMALVPAFHVGLWLLLLLAAVMLAGGYRMGARPGWRTALRPAAGAAGASSGWVVGGSGRSPGGGSGSSGGGFGGGSSGGGGASGSW